MHLQAHKAAEFLGLVCIKMHVDPVARLELSQGSHNVAGIAAPDSLHVHVDGELAYVISGAFGLYFDDLEAEALPGSDPALPCVVGPMWRLCKANVSKNKMDGPKILNLDLFIF